MNTMPPVPAALVEANARMLAPLRCDSCGWSWTRTPDDGLCPECKRGLTLRDPMAEHRAVAAEWDKRPRPEGDELSRMTARALRAEAILVAIWRRLDDYRERGQAMPSYAELVRLLQG